MSKSTLFIVILGSISMLSCNKDEKPVNPYPRETEFTFLYNGQPTSINGDFGLFSFDSRWKSQLLIENSIMDSLLSIRLYHPLDKDVSYRLACSYKIWYNGDPNRIHERLDLNTHFSSYGNSDFNKYYWEVDVWAVDYLLDPEFDNYIQITYVSPDRREIRGEISYRAIVDPRHAHLRSRPPDTLTYEDGKFRIKNLY
jgi:hypothetical protein